MENNLKFENNRVQVELPEGSSTLYIKGYSMREPQIEYPSAESAARAFFRGVEFEKRKLLYHLAEKTQDVKKINAARRRLLKIEDWRF